MLKKLLSFGVMCLFLSKNATAGIKHNKDDKYFGVVPQSAKVVMIEYGSLTCPHCSDFFNKYIPKLKQKYIDNGKSLSIVHRIFVADGPSLMAMMAVKCKELSKEKYNKIISSLYQTSQDWAFTQDFPKKLEDFFAIHGYTREEFRKCITDQNIKQKIIEERIEAVNSGLYATPSVFINGRHVKNIASSNIELEIENELKK